MRCRVRQASPDLEGSLARCLLYALIIIYLQMVLLLSGVWLDQEGEERGSIFAVARHCLMLEGHQQAGELEAAVRLTG